MRPKCGVSDEGRFGEFLSWHNQHTQALSRLLLIRCGEADFDSIIDNQIHKFIKTLQDKSGPRPSFLMEVWFITYPDLALDAHGQLLIQPYGTRYLLL
jgi:hypothetical protein